MSKLASATLMCLVAGLAYANWRIWTGEVDVSPLAAGVGKAGAAPAAGKVEAAQPKRTVAEFPETLARPVFFPDRRMPAPPSPKPQAQAQAAAEAKAPLPPLTPLHLVGIRGIGRTQQVLVRIAPDAQGTWVSVGDSYRGWNVREVVNDVAVVEGRGQRTELRLYSGLAAARR